MTAQLPDRLENRHPTLDLGDLELYGVSRGTPPSALAPYAFTAEVERPEGLQLCSALWSGYVGVFRVDPDATVTLEGYAFPFTEPHVPDEAKLQRVGERLTGDFWLCLRPDFFAPTTWLPARDGVLSTDPNTWLLPDPPS